MACAGIATASIHPVIGSTVDAIPSRKRAWLGVHELALVIVFVTAFARPTRLAATNLVIACFKKNTFSTRGVTNGTPSAVDDKVTCELLRKISAVGFSNSRYSSKRRSGIRGTS